MLGQNQTVTSQLLVHSQIFTVHVSWERIVMYCYLAYQLSETIFEHNGCSHMKFKKSFDCDDDTAKLYLLRYGINWIDI